MSPRPTALYRLFAADGELLYVGYTYDLDRRFGEHAKDKSWWPEVSQPPQLEWYDDAVQAEKAETIAIALERPRHNIDPQDAPVQPDLDDFGAAPSRIAAILKAEIIAGTYGDSGPHAPSQTMIAKRFGVSAQSGSVVLRQLAAEGWVTLEQGRGTYLRTRHRFEVAIEIPPTNAAAVDPDADSKRLLAAIIAAKEAEPAAYSIDHAELHLGGTRIGLGICAASSGKALRIAESLIESVRDAWSWDGWDLAGASVTAGPA